VSDEPVVAPGPSGTLQILARLAAVASGVALFSGDGWSALQRILAGRPYGEELRFWLALTVPYLVVAVLPWPRTPGWGRWLGVPLIAVPFLIPGPALISTSKGFWALGAVLPLIVFCQIPLFAAGVALLTWRGSRPPRRRFGASFWALVLTGCSPAGLLFGISLIVRGHPPNNESDAIGDTRVVISAQAAFEDITGAFAVPHCLEAPSDCSADYPASGPAFTGAEPLELLRSGYLRTFHATRAGAPAPPFGEEHVLAAYAIVMVPVEPEVTGIRSFCGDHTGRICYYADGRTPWVADGRCPADCLDLH